MAHHESCKTTTEDDKFNCPHFAINQEALARVVEANNIKSLDQYGGINGIASALQTNLDTGIHGDPKDLYRRHETYGSNHHNLEDNPPCVSSKWLYKLCLDAFKDTTIILLLCCGLLSLVIGIKKNGLKEGFLDGAILFLSMFIVINVGAICRYFKARMIKKLSRNNQKIVGVMRGEKIQDMPVSEVVVGDIVILKKGDQLPADGLFLHGDSMFVLDDVLECNNYYKCPSLFTGSKVMGGECYMLVTSVGRNTERSKLMRSMSFDDYHNLETPIDNVNSRLEKIWLILSLVLLVVQMVRCFVWESLCDENQDLLDSKGMKNTMEEIMNETTKLMKKQLGPKVNGLVAMLCILVFALRDGLPLGTFIYLSYASKIMMFSHRARIRKLQACVAVGSITTICTGITGDLALQHTKMTDLWVGHHKLSTEVLLVDHHHTLIDALREGVCMNARGPAKDVLLCWAQKFLGVDIEELNRSYTIINRKAHELNQTGVLLTRKGDMEKVVHVHWKGAPQIVLSMCSHYYNFDGAMQTLDQQKRDEFKKIIESIGCDHTIKHCFAFAYKKLVREQNDEEEEEEEIEEEDDDLLLPEDGLTLLAIVALKNPYADEGVNVRESIEKSRESGVKIKLLVNEDINIARFMAINSGIIRLDEEDAIGAVIEASKFRNSSDEDRMNMVDSLRVMSNASPEDKLLLLQCLRQKEGEVVAVTGTSTRDSPWLKQADVGILVDGGCEELVKTKSSDIVILDLKLMTVCKILEFGRSVRYYLNKLFKLQLTLNNAAFSLNFIAAMLCTSDQVPLNSFHILWVNLIMNVLAALALASLVVDPPNTYDQRKYMHIDIVVQSVYQVTVLLVLNMRGKDVLKVDEETLKLIIFNCYLLCQVFVLISTARKIKKQWFLMMVVVAILVLQVCLIEIGAFVTHWERLDLKQWCICIGISTISLPIGWVANLLP